LRNNPVVSTAARALRATQVAFANVLDRVSSGRRVVSSGDDAAGLAVATNLSIAATSSRQAIRNSNDGISVLHTSESAVAEYESILQRMRELAVQSSSGTLAATERTYVSREFDALESELQRIFESTEFNGIKLTDGTNSSLTVQVGIGGGTESEIVITLPDLAAVYTFIATTDLSSATNSQTTIGTVDTAHDLLNAFRSRIGTGEHRLSSAIANQTAYAFALDSAASQIVDADMAMETAAMTKYQVMQQAGIAALAQAGGMNRAVISLLG
jgi:flagellin